MHAVVDFDWTPKSEEISFTIGGNVYPPVSQEDGIVRASDSRYDSFSTPTNTPITFTADVQAEPGVTIIEYRWNFGDGSEGFGPVVAHEYLAASPQTQVTLIVTDDKGRSVSRHQTLNLRPSVRITVRPAIVVSPV